MNDVQIEVPYNHDLEALENVLAGVQRPGSFFVQGALNAPMPRVDVEGIGVLSFPVPEAQSRALVERCERAPYGRGTETVLDTSVRKVWQLSPSRFDIGGKPWPGVFAQILDTVANGLGCNGANVTAELYKLLVYDEGAFFKTHRDTEKADGMFGTLLIVLPSPHTGGDLVVRHAGKEARFELSGDEVSELRFAAFYADCEHEVLPVTEGNRVCLVYNLLQSSSPGTKRKKALKVPNYDAEAAAAGTILKKTFAQPNGPRKIAWLLEHQYSPATLSFTALKNADAALSQVLREAAERADCAVHLSIVHIEEYGPAELLTYGYNGGYGWYDEPEEVSREDYEVVEVSYDWRYIDHWVNPDDVPVGFGKIPLGEGEVLPAGALDDELPDEQRVTEATGNEGASFERSYHRAALLIWPRNRFVNVLLQAGVQAALPYLDKRVESCSTAASAGEADLAVILAEIRKVIKAWEVEMRREQRFRAQYADGDADDYYAEEPTKGDRSRMVALLGRLADNQLLERFVSEVVTTQFDGSENEALAAVIETTDSKRLGGLLLRLVQRNTARVPRASMQFFARLIDIQRVHEDPDWQAATRDIGAAIVASKDHFDVRTVLVPALEQLYEHGRPAIVASEVELLWLHAADTLLTNTERPPAPPEDWRQEVAIACRCADCRELQAFARDRVQQSRLFAVRKDRRRHLHRQIERHRLDMEHVTERKGRPFSLICTKTRRSYELRCQVYKEDVATLVTLKALLATPSGELGVRCLRIDTLLKRGT